MDAASSHAASSVVVILREKEKGEFSVVRKRRKKSHLFLRSLSFSALSLSLSLSISPSPASLPRISPSRASKALDCEVETSAKAASREASDAVGWLVFERERRLGSKFSFFFEDRIAKQKTQLSLSLSRTYRLLPLSFDADSIFSDVFYVCEGGRRRRRRDGVSLGSISR
jgi:hypothetical protein